MDQVSEIVAGMSSAYLAELEDLDAEMRIYEIKAKYGVSLRVAFQVVKALSAGGKS